jgi:hypothetical protein
VVRGGDHHGIDILPGEEFAEIAELRAARAPVVAVDGLAGALAAVREDVADRDDAAIILLKELVEVHPEAVGADANAAEGDLARRGAGAEEAGG